MPAMADQPIVEDDILRKQVEEKKRSLQQHLGERRPGEVMSEMAPTLKRMIAEVEPRLLTIPERKGKWSILEVVHHLADAEMVYGVRVRMMLAEDRPQLHAWDQTKWAAHLGYAEGKIEHALEQFRVLRSANLRLFQSLSSEQFSRVGIHPERGAESVYVAVLSMAVHDEIHLRQIRRIREGLR